MENEEGCSTTISENPNVLTELSNTKENKREIRAKKLLERLKLSGVEHSPKFNNGNTEIDLSQPSDRDDCWLKERFPSLTRTRKKLQNESHAGGKLPSKLVKNSLRSSLLAKTRAELEKRRLQYKEDNQDIFASDEEEEEEEMEKTKRKKKKVSKPITDSDEDADEDWVEGKSDNDEDAVCEDSDDNDDEEDDVEGESNSEDEKEDEVNVGNPSQLDGKADVDTEGTNSQEKSSSAESATSNETLFPSTLSQWFNDDNDRSQDLTINTDKRTKAMEKASSLVDDELLNLCSGRFDSQVDDDSEALASDCVTDEEDEVILKKKNKGSVLQENDESPKTDKNEAENEERISPNPAVNQEEVKHVILESDEESENEEANNGLIEGSAPNDNNEEEVEEDEEDNESEDEGAEAGNGDEEDDELAEYNRFLRADYKKKLKKNNYFDDEASLSGDDVGSDLDEELDENNEYEMEEGDNDDIPDADVIQLQNQKYFMKQELQQEHREIVRFQERLLADGDLGGTRTNRSFRIKLREEFESSDATEELTGCSVDDGIENDEDMKLGTEALRMKRELEQTSTLNISTEMTAEECALENAGVAALTASESLGVKKVIPTLLNKAPLVAMFRETTSVAVKQLYTSNVSSSTTTSKRVVAAETESVAKRRKGNLLDILND